jgi:glycerol uptake facilitator-like aquaporin
MQKYLAELIGTFFLVLTIGCTVIGHGAGPLAPLAIGSGSGKSTLNFDWLRGPA